MMGTSLSFMRRQRRRPKFRIKWWLQLSSTGLAKDVAFGAHEVGFDVVGVFAAFLLVGMKRPWTGVVGDKYAQIVAVQA